MKSLYNIIAITILAILVIGCNSKETKEKNNSNVDTIQLEEPIISSPIFTDSLIENCSNEDALSYLKESNDWDKYSTGIIPSIIEQDLKYARKLINNQYPHFIFVDKRTMMVILYNKFGQRELNFKMACGKNYGTKHKKADSRTPEGYFICGGKYDSTDWLFTDDNGYTSPIKGQFGPRFIRINAPITTQIGIHGTHARYSIGRRCSHGCIRIQNEEILYLHKFAKKGMPIIVNPGEKDNKINKEEGYDIPMIILSDTIIDNPKEFFEFKKEIEIEQARKDSIEAAIILKAKNDSIAKAKLDSISKFSDSISTKTLTDSISTDSIKTDITYLLQ